MFKWFWILGDNLWPFNQWTQHSFVQKQSVRNTFNCALLIRLMHHHIAKMSFCVWILSALPKSRPWGTSPLHRWQRWSCAVISGESPLTIGGLHIPSYTLDNPSYTLDNLHIPSHTFIYLKITDIRKMRTNMRYNNGHNSGSKACPTARIWHTPSYHIPRGSGMPQGPEI